MSTDKATTGGPVAKNVIAGRPVQWRHKELGVFMRACRARVASSEVGLPLRKRRHVPGLRREEVAQLAGVGVSWYTLLEQGRLEHVSLKALRCLTQALLLSPIETEHAFALARVADTPTRTLELPRRELHEFVRGYTDGAAFVNDRRSCVVSWNAFANELFDFSGVPPRERNMLALMVRRSRTREVFVDAHEAIARMIGVFRVTCAEYVDPERDALVAELRAESAEFDRLWQAFTIDALIAHIFILRHERLGEVRMQFMAFTPVDHPDHTVVTLRERGPTRAARNTPSGKALRSYLAGVLWLIRLLSLRRCADMTIVLVQSVPPADVSCHRRWVVPYAYTMNCWK